MSVENPFQPIYDELSDIKRILLNIKNPISTPDLPDRIDFDTFLELIGTKEHPASKAQGYHLTSKKLVPFKKFGSKLIFSRKELAVWLEANTLSPSSPADEVKANLVKSANKHLRNAK